MSLRLTGMVIATSLLAACGGGGNEQPAEATGVLQAGGIKGVHYSTPTRSGETDANGTFKYLPGETVAFSIGGIELGAVPGAAQITPFTLAGLTPPTTEFALRRELDRAMRLSTPFVRAINLGRLLIALDADHNPANGLDVGGRASALANTELDLGQNVWSFAANLRKITPNQTNNIPVSRPLVYLYSALRLSVPVHAQTNAETAYPVGILPSASFTTYYADGTRSSDGSDYNDDGVPEYQNTWTYDALGRQTSYVGLQSGFFGAGQVSLKLSYEHDASGNLTGGTEEQDSDGDGLLDRIARHDLDFDAFGFALGEVIELDGNADGVFDGRATSTNRFDARHNFVFGTNESDYERDGIANESMSTAVDYDSRDRAVSVVSEFDSDANGTVDSRYADSYDFAGAPANAGATRQVGEQDYDADGIADARVVLTTTFDRAGNPTARVEEWDNDADNVIDSRTRTDSTYDSARHLLTSERREDYDGDGIFDVLTTLKDTYDSIGNVQSSEYQYDFDLDGAFDAQQVTSYEYGTSGELLSFGSDTFSQSYVDVFPGGTTTVTNTEFADGVLHLAQEYLDFRGSVVAAH